MPRTKVVYSMKEGVKKIVTMKIQQRTDSQKRLELLEMNFQARKLIH
jgi:hypothetical protein